MFWSLSYQRTGTAIYVFFILPNFLKGLNLASAVLCDFFIDGVHVGSFTHQSDGSGAFTYNALVYNNTSVQNGDHVLLIETTGSEPAIIIFDHAIYTYVPLRLSSSSLRSVLVIGNLYPTLHLHRLQSPPPPPPSMQPSHHRRLWCLTVTRAPLQVNFHLLPHKPTLCLLFQLLQAHQHLLHSPAPRSHFS